MNDLAGHANCSNSTIRDFEAHRREPHKNRLMSIQQALEAAGIVFTGDPGGMVGIAGKPRGKGPRAAPIVEREASADRKRKKANAKKRT